MKKFNYIVIILGIIFAIIAFVYFKTSSDDFVVRDMNFDKDFAQINALFHKEDNWYWMISNYSREHGYDLEFVMRYRSSSPYETRYDLIVKVLDIDHKVAGLVAYYPKSPYTWQFLFLLVDQEFRGRGFAKKLLSYAVDDMVKRGAVKIDTLTRMDNIRAQAIYNKFGFKPNMTTEEHMFFAWHKAWQP